MRENVCVYLIQNRKTPHTSSHILCIYQLSKSEFIAVFKYAWGLNGGCTPKVGGGATQRFAGARPRTGPHGFDRLHQWR